MPELASCRCRAFSPVDEYACTSAATQEDLLCNQCRPPRDGSGHGCIWIGGAHACVTEFEFRWNLTGLAGA